jgi:hypothetical protein
MLHTNIDYIGPKTLLGAVAAEDDVDLDAGASPLALTVTGIIQSTSPSARGSYPITRIHDGDCVGIMGLMETCAFYRRSRYMNIEQALSTGDHVTSAETPTCICCSSKSARKLDSLEDAEAALTEIEEVIERLLERRALSPRRGTAVLSISRLPLELFDARQRALEKLMPKFAMESFDPIALSPSVALAFSRTVSSHLHDALALGSLHPVLYDGAEYPTDAHLLEALRFAPDGRGYPGAPEMAERVRTLRSVDEARQFASGGAQFGRPDWDDVVLQEVSRPCPFPHTRY